MDRRVFLAGAGAVVASAAAARVPAPLGGPALRQAVAQLETASRGRLGVAVVDAASGMSFGWRGGERFPMCSTFKAPLAAAVLAAADAGTLDLGRALPVRRSDLVAYAPFTQTRGGGSAPIAELCAAAVGVSDNAAANLLLGVIGGPPGLTRFLRRTGDRATRLDRTEPTLNTALPGDPRDTTTPLAIAHTLHRLALGRVLAPASRTRLVGWMESATTGGKRLRAGVPSGWRVADKTGTGANGTNNVIALLWPAGRAQPLVVASYLTGSPLPAAEQDAVHARLARAIAAAV